MDDGKFNELCREFVFAVIDDIIGRDDPLHPSDHLSPDEAHRLGELVIERPALGALLELYDWATSPERHLNFEPLSETLGMLTNVQEQGAGWDAARTILDEIGWLRYGAIQLRLLAWMKDETAEGQWLDPALVALQPAAASSSTEAQIGVTPAALEHVQVVTWYWRAYIDAILSAPDLESHLGEIPDDLDQFLSLSQDWDGVSLLAESVGSLKGTIRERRRRGATTPATNAWVERLETTQREAAAMQRAAFELHLSTRERVEDTHRLASDIHETTRVLLERLGATEELLLESLSVFNVSVSGVADEKLANSRDQIILAWQATHSARETKELEVRAQDLVGKAAWDRLQNGTKTDLTLYLSWKDHWKPEFLRTVCLTVYRVFEVELKAALRRLGVAYIPREGLLSFAQGQSDSRLQPVLTAVGGARLDDIRNRAVHGDAVHPSDLQRLESVLFGDKTNQHGVLGRVALIP